MILVAKLCKFKEFNVLNGMNMYQNLSGMDKATLELQQY
jgi:hypothetical protein